MKSESFPRSVVSNSLQPHTPCPTTSCVHGIFQARILEWVATPFSRGSSWPRDQTQISCTANRLITIWATREAQISSHKRKISVFIKIKWILCLHLDYLWLSHICSYIFYAGSETQRKGVIDSRIQLLSNSTVPRTPVPTQCLSGKSPGTHYCQTE